MVDKGKLRQLLTDTFSMEELRTLCQDLGIRHDMLPSSTGEVLARELIELLEREGQLEELVNRCKQLRPGVARWDELEGEVNEVQQPTSTEPPLPDPGEGNEPGRKPVRWIAAAIVISVTVAAAAIVIALRNGDDPHPRVALKTTHDHYVTAMDGALDPPWLLRAETSTRGDWEEFKLLCLDNGKLALQTWHERYATALGGDRDWVLIGEAAVIDRFEEFTLIDVETREQRACLEVVESLEEDDDTTVALLTFHNRFVTAMDWGYEPAPWALRGETDELGASEEFIVSLLP